MLAEEPNVPPMTKTAIPATAPARERGGGMTTVAVVVAAIVGAGCASAPTTGATVGPRATTAADYYPLERGWKWGYAIETGGETGFKAFTVLERTPDTAILQ